MVPTSWSGRFILLIAVGGLLLLAYTFMNPHTQQKEELIASIIKNWQQAHPAAQRFVILPHFNNEAVLDKETGLVWELSPQPTFVTWNQARVTCVTRATGGQKGWRLPAPAEMRSLVGPAVDSPIPNIPPGHPFLNIQPTSYWTVVPEANQPSYARYVDAFLGNVLSFMKIYTYPVWCVRGPITSDDR
ncbi:MAG: hypothetical protein A4E19_10580 [Nitrospira sp. SG-bin1]|nr:MAG: hypothetical protein A4E19_10580 [Nitrospira sp. SG-bin1]